MLIKKVFDCIGRDREKLIIDHHAYPLLTLAHAKRPCELDLVDKVVGMNEILQRLNDLPRSLDVTRRTNTNCNFHKKILIDNRQR